MKVESKHGTKIPKYAVGAALLAATTLIGGCDLNRVTNDDSEDHTVEYMGDTAVCEDYWDDDTDNSTETTVETDFGLTSVNGAVSNQYGLNAEQYDLFMKKIDEVEETEPGAYKYAIGAAKDRNTETYYFVLMTVKGVFTTCYAVSNGELVVLDSNPGDLKVSTSGALPYEEIKRLPCLVDTTYLMHKEFTEDGVTDNPYTPYVDSIDDGEYFGEIIGLTDDGTRVLLKIGKPVILDYDYVINQVGPNEPIGFKDFIKTVDKVEYEDQTYGIVITSPTYKFDQEIALRRYRTVRGETDIVHVIYDFQFWVEDYVIVELPLAEDCKVFNYSEYRKYGKEYEPNWNENGDPMTHTQFFVQHRKEKFSYPYDGRWITIPSMLRTTYKSDAIVYSVIISDGQVKQIEMDAYVS